MTNTLTNSGIGRKGLLSIIMGMPSRPDLETKDHTTSAVKSRDKQMYPCFLACPAFSTAHTALGPREWSHPNWDGSSKNQCNSPQTYPQSIWYRKFLRWDSFQISCFKLTFKANHHSTELVCKILWVFIDYVKINLEETINFAFPKALYRKDTMPM